VAAILDRSETQLVGAADCLSALDTRAGQPHAEAMRVMIAPRFAIKAAIGWSVSPACSL
jgi:hypothetical protein